MRKATKIVDWAYKQFEMHSDSGIGILLVNVLIMLWVCLITGKKMPDQTAAIVGVIFAAKTTHGVMTYRRGEDNDNE